MAFDGLTSWVISSLLISLRVSPVFALAPPFSLTRVPPLFRVLFGLGLAGALAAGNPAAAHVVDTHLSTIVITALRELMLGATIVLAFQLMFGALYLAGRTIDIQAGFGLAMLIDPTSKAQTPLVGTLFAYLAGAVFFALNGHHDLMRVLGASLQAIPIGHGAPQQSLASLLGFISAVFVTAFGVAGGTILCLFLTDAVISLMSRTIPQMNVLMLGLQVKTILMLVVLPVTLGTSSALLARMVRITLESIPGLL